MIRLKSDMRTRDEHVYRIVTKGQWRQARQVRDWEISYHEVMGICIGKINRSCDYVS